MGEVGLKKNKYKGYLNNKQDQDIFPKVDLNIVGPRILWGGGDGTLKDTLYTYIITYKYVLYICMIYICPYIIYSCIYMYIYVVYLYI